MHHEPIEIVRVIRRMRGGSQAHLVEGCDGLHYVAKFTGNPLGNRTLINEWYAHHLFRRLGVSTPPLRVLRLPEAVSKELAFETENTRIRVEPGLHLGSQCPVNPETTVIYDFLPRKVISRTANPEDFAKTLVLDLFLGQADARQAIFVREGSGSAWQMRAYMIDHGWMFGGSSWQLSPPQRPSLYYDQTVYSLCDLSTTCEQTLALVSALTDETFEQWGANIPSVWFSSDDQAEWVPLVRRLSAGRSQLPGLLHECLQRLNPEPPGPSRVVKFREKTSNLFKAEQPVARTSALLALG